MTPPKPKIIVLASGSEQPDKSSGQTFKALAQATVDGVLNAQIVGVASHHQQGSVADLAREYGIPFSWIENPKDPECYLDLWESFDYQLRVLAGYNYKVHYPGRKTVNIHPALLPECGGKGWYGRQVHERVAFALRYNLQTEYGLTIHFAGEEIDTGPTILQLRVALPPHCRWHIRAENLEETVKAHEQYWYPRVINRILTDQIRWDGLHNDSLIVPDGYRSVCRIATGY